MRRRRCAVRLAARRRRATYVPLLALAVAAGVGGCELQEIVTAEAEEILVAEVVLRAGVGPQTALLQRTTAPPGTEPDSAATITVVDELGREIRFQRRSLEFCVAHPDTMTRGATCFVEGPGTTGIAAGRVHTLRIETADGRVLTGRTTTPGEFATVEPAAAFCQLPADSSITLRWRASRGAWAYIVEARFGGLRAAMAERGIAIDEDPVVLTGVSVSAADTSLAFPGGLGVFSRFDEQLAPVLIELQNGVPVGVNTTIIIAAADRNYVNWVRGGNFNPSGAVRVGSIHGDGVGVFGSVTQAFMRIDTRPGSQLPAC